MRSCRQNSVSEFSSGPAGGRRAGRAAIAAALALLLVLLPGCADKAAGGAASSSPASYAAASSSAPTRSSSAAASAASVSASVSPAAVSSSSHASSSSHTAHASSKSAAPAPGGSGGKPSVQTAPVSQTVTLSVDGSKGGAGVILSAQAVALKSGDTAYTVLNRVCGQRNIVLSPKDASGSVYVSRIGSLSEFDGGSQSGWIYSVNGSYPGTGCNAYALKAGDAVRWVYTVDSGKTEEAGQ